MALDAVTAVFIAGVVLLFFLLFLFVRRVITNFTEGYQERR